MGYRLSADLILILHLAFVLFVALGGFLVPRRPRLAWLHLPAVAWGVLSEWLDAICPLTPLETAFREFGGGTGYGGGFIEHYIAEVIYPKGLTRGLQVALGIGALLLNMAIYGCWLFRKGRFRSRHR